MKIGVLAAVAAIVVSFHSAAMAEPVRGFGRDVPMSAAMRQVVPDGWAVSYGAGVDSAQVVSWRGAEDWRAVVDDMCNRRGLTVSYDQEARSVRVTRSDDQRVQMSTASSKGGFVMVPYRAGPAQGNGWQNYQGGAAPAGGSWVAKKDQTLRGVLADWGQRAGWTVVYQSGFEYRLEAGAAFGGDFMQASGDLVRSMQSAKPALTATFHKGNQTLVIANDNAGAN
ncbi:hypothetical protein ACVIGB_000846 [Bradyrhizobium sp. USDA 4341]